MAVSEMQISNMTSKTALVHKVETALELAVRFNPGIDSKDGGTFAGTAMRAEAEAMRIWESRFDPVSLKKVSSAEREKLLGVPAGTKLSEELERK